MAEVTEKSFPFDSEEINGEYDRAYVADDFARYFREFITSGVFMKESTNLQIFENGDMTVTLKPGKMIIDGYRYDNTDDIIIQIEPADGVLNRIDRISATWSKEDRDIHYTLQKGKPAYEPVPPECRRNADMKDYVLADVYISAGAIYITQADITDQRLNSAVCGIANPFNKVDTTSIFIQFTSWLKITKEKGEADVAELVVKMEAYLELLEISGNNQLEEILNDLRAWLDRMKGQLSEDAAGHLQVKIDELQEKLDEIETPDFDDSGEISGIGSFTDFMASFITRTPICQFFANLKAGLKYVLHAGQLVNNGMCDTPGEFALDAAYGHTMTEQITQLYSKIADGINVRYNVVTHYIQILVNGEWINYAYFNSTQAVPLVPIMTSNNTPYGICSASSINTQYFPYRAFDRTGYGWINTGYDTSAYLQYKFEHPVTISSLVVKNTLRSGTGTWKTVTATIQTSIDGVIWTDVGTMEYKNNKSEQNYTFQYAAENITYVRFNLPPNQGAFAVIDSLQYYGYAMGEI